MAQHTAVSNAILNFTFSAPCIVIHICETDQQTHTCLDNLFHLNYPRHVSSNQFFMIRRSSVQAAYSIL